MSSDCVPPTHPGQCDLAFAMVALMLRRAPIAAVARSIGRYPPCNKMYHIEELPTRTSRNSPTERARHAKPHARTQCSSGSGRQEQPHARTQCSRGAPGPLALGPLVLLVVLASPRCPCCTSAERFGGDLSSGTRRSLELGGALMEADEVREAVGEGRSAAARAELCSCAGPSFGRKGGFIQPVARRGLACNPYVRWIFPKTIGI